MPLTTLTNHCLARIFTLVMLVLVTASISQAQGPTPQNRTGDVKKTISPVVGKWTYRSFLSNPDLNAEPNGLLFDSGTMDLSVSEPDSLTGTLGGEGWQQLTLTGKVTSREPTSIRFTGKGVIGGEEWVYDYLDYAVPTWPNGVDQRPAIVGTIVRAKAHTGGAAKAGVVAQWIAVPASARSASYLHTNPKSIRSSPYRHHFPVCVRAALEMTGLMTRPLGMSSYCHPD